jgi:hypothetical protein
MKIVEIKDMEDCFDGSFIKEILLDGPVTREIILFFGNAGELQYFPTFPRPFYRLDGRYFVLQGIEGSRTIRITLNRKDVNQSLICFKELIANYINEVLDE